jgi:hypothetical protein
MTKRITGALDANPVSGTSAIRLGVGEGETITSQGLYAKAKDFEGDLIELMSSATPSKYGVRTISAEPVGVGGARLSGEEFSQVIVAVSKFCEYLCVDTANDITSDMSLSVIESADVLVFTANVAVQDSLEKLRTSMETLRQHGFNRKVDDSVVVISNLPQGKDPEQYHRYVIGTEDNPTNFGGKIVSIPHDPYIAMDDVVKLEQLQPQTLQAYRLAIIAILEQAGNKF